MKSHVGAPAGHVMNRERDVCKNVREWSITLFTSVGRMESAWASCAFVVIGLKRHLGLIRSTLVEIVRWIMNSGPNEDRYTFAQNLTRHPFLRNT